MSDSEIPFISIVTPVYNSREYLEQCLDSVLCQNFDSFEWLLIDDGSDDGSRDFLAERAKSDLRFKVELLDHSGVCAARNRALELARGEYVMFIDSDDFVKPDTLAKVAGQLHREQPDILMCRAEYYYEDGRTVPMMPEYDFADGVSGMTMEEVLHRAFRMGGFWSMCNNIIRRELFAGMRFDPAFPRCQDFDLTVRIFLHARRFAVHNEIFYEYRQLHDRRPLNVAKWSCFFAVCRKLFDIFSAADLSEKGRRNLGDDVLYLSLVSGCRMLRELPPKERKNVISELDWLPEYAARASRKRYRMLGRMYRMCGIESGSRMVFFERWLRQLLSGKA